ncbi:Uncharacterized protein PECH_007419 [Penicillium ucsense]|uniref:Transcription initiation factor TFIID subunit 4 n=1 Tax=Penicillium ucsense TaxID=2839758 RepID=A0A8J8WKJ6_9EURO|nr:Uncharacterized protein PECM_000075 [Penicillium ucsense]KAF7734878.1 Uncharacterized protein PECH_007419 [Penicillium ucsense]
MAQTRPPHPQGQQQQQQQPPPQFATHPFSPPVSSPSPHSGQSPVNGSIAPPPQKKPRLSPLPPSQTQSPYASPSFGAMQLPPAQPQVNGMATNLTPSTPTGAAPAPGTMGPPSRPVDKTTDAAELTDVLASSGIDVREEEAFLTRSFSGPNAQAQAANRPPLPKQPSQTNASFSSQTSTAGTVSATSSFGDLPNNKPAAAPSSFSTDPTSQSSTISNQPTRANTEAARRAQYHLQEPFLFAKLVEQKIQKRGFELGVRIPSEGLFHPVPGRQAPIEVTGPDGSSIVRTGQTILNQEGAPLVDILNLVSLSCEERLRGVIDYASTLARSRRAHSHGVVPDAWVDIAKPLGPTAGNTVTPSKRPHLDGDAAARKPPAERYKGFVTREGSRENKRAAKRAKRGTSGTAVDEPSARYDPVAIMGSAPSTPVGERAPSFDSKKSMTKKEQKKMMDNKANEAQQHQQSVETARLATNSMLSGRMFGAKKSYSWLKPGGSSSGFSTPTRPAPSTPTTTAATTGPEKPTQSGETPAGPPKRRLGTWREDQEKGRGIQVRDILFAVEADGRASKHVQKGYSRDPKEDRGS